MSIKSIDKVLPLSITSVIIRHMKNDIRQQLKELIANRDLRGASIRKVGRMLEVDGKEVHPETVKYHWKKLFEDDEVSYLYDGSVQRAQSSALSDAILPSGNQLVSIPVLGVADCGPATKVADESDLGKITISTQLLDTKKYDTLYAIQASGESMNSTSIKGRPINDGDYVVVDRSKVSPRNGDCVVAIVDGLANIKRFYQEQDRIVLASESTENYDPIFVTFEDQSDSLIGGTVIQVIEKPKYL